MDGAQTAGRAEPFRLAGGRFEIARPGWLTDAIAMDIAFVIAISLLALFLRTVNLGEYPYGLHGDEASTGLDARRILDGESIWPYTGSALGQPAGPMYWSVPFHEVFGSTVFAVRLPMALLGVGTVIFGFLAFRELFGRPTAYVGAVLLACSSWLLFYNRTGYSVSAMPFTEMLSLWAVALALRKRFWPWYAGAGAIVGAGIYGYYSYPLFAIGLGIFVLVHFAIDRPRPALQHAGHLAIMGLAALLLVQPMWPWLTDPDRGYRHDRTLFAVSNTESYKALDSTSAKIDAYWDNAGDVTQTLLREGINDFSDGTGTKPALDGLTVVIFGAGLGVCAMLAWRRRRAAYLLPFLIIPFVMIGPFWSVGGYHRRSLAVLPFVLMPAAVLLGYVWESLVASRPESKWLVTGAIAVVLAGYAAINVQKYFDTMNDTDVMRGVYAPELTLAARFIEQQPDDARVYFAASRWSAGYETMQYLVPDRNVEVGVLEDRSKEFAKSVDGFDDIDRTRPAVIVLMGEYQSQAGALAARYPEAEQLAGKYVAGRPSFIALRIPAED